MNEAKTKNRTKSNGKQKGYQRRSFDPLLFLNAAGTLSKLLNPSAESLFLFRRG